MTHTNLEMRFSMLFQISVPIFIIIYSILFYRTSVYFFCVVALALLLCFTYLISLFLNEFWRKLLQSITLLFIVTYLLLEFTTYVLLSMGIIRTDMRFYYGGFEACNRPLVRYDTISGYKGISGTGRYISISNGLVEFDHTITVNQQGYFSKRDYRFTKEDSTVKRYMILGDSYSSGVALATPVVRSVAK